LQVEPEKLGQVRVAGLGGKEEENEKTPEWDGLEEDDEGSQGSRTQLTLDDQRGPVLRGIHLDASRPRHRESDIKTRGGERGIYIIRAAHTETVSSFAQGGEGVSGCMCKRSLDCRVLQ